MCTLSNRFFSTMLCAFSLYTACATAQQISPGGVIHFRGEIVESPCEVSTHQQQIQLSCIRDGEIYNSRYNEQQVMMSPQNVKQIASVKMHYLNEQKNLAILDIEYK